VSIENLAAVKPPAEFRRVRVGENQEAREGTVVFDRFSLTTSASNDFPKSDSGAVRQGGGTGDVPFEETNRHPNQSRAARFNITRQASDLEPAKNATKREAQNGRH
jgi:hypothetical protein